MAKLDLGYKTVELYIPGQIVRIKHITGETHEIWDVLRNTVIWEDGNEPVQMLTLLAIDDEGEDLGKEPITVNSDMYEIMDV